MNVFYTEYAQQHAGRGPKIVHSETIEHHHKPSLSLKNRVCVLYTESEKVMRHASKSKILSNKTNSYGSTLSKHTYQGSKSMNFRGTRFPLRALLRKYACFSPKINVLYSELLRALLRNLRVLPRIQTCFSRKMRVLNPESQRVLVRKYACFTPNCCVFYSDL